jgi:hypothetical protein
VEEVGLDVAEPRARDRLYVERFGVATETETDPATA